MKRILRALIRQQTILTIWAAALWLSVDTPAATERIVRPDGDADLIETMAGTPFTRYRRELRNLATTDREVRMIEFTREVPLAVPPREYRTLGVDGLKGAEAPASSYLFLGIAKPDASDATVAGWITQERGSGSVHSQATASGVAITGRLEFGRLRLKPGQTVITDAFVLGHFTDARQGLETYADAIAQANRIKLPKIPNFQLGTRLYFLHNRVWHNDPDCLMVRAPLTLTQARSFASWIAVSGSLNLISEWLPGLPADRLDCLKRSLPNTGLAARPLDLFENMPARAWHLTDGKRHVLGLFNWDASKPSSVSVKLGQLGLSTEESRVIGLDYWSGALVPLRDGAVSAELPPSGCSIIALAGLRDRPQLLGTSRHITQCFVDVGEDQWTNAVLTGICKLVGGDPTELRLSPASTRGRWKPMSAAVSPADQEAGVTWAMKEEGGLVRVTLAAPANCEVRWSVLFDPTPDSSGKTAPLFPTGSLRRNRAPSMRAARARSSP